jgi:hypothetical protein
MKTSIMKFAVALGAVVATAPAYGQYQAPAQGGAYRAPVYSPYAAAPNAGQGRPQFTASRPTTPVAQQSVPSFRPVNPPSQSTKRILMASRTAPTPAPTPVRAPASTAQAAPQSNPSMWQPSMNAQDWNPPTPSMHTNMGAGGYGGQQPYAGQQQGGPADGNVPSGDVGGGECGAEGCAPGCGRGCCLFGHSCCFRSPGDMVLHMPFFGTTHGYYYFRPYHVMHVFSQQELATRWGGDPRNPYDNRMFERVYQQMGVDVKSTTPTTNTMPSNIGLPTMSPEYVTPNQGMPTPTPVPMYPQNMQPNMQVPQAPGMSLPTVPSPNGIGPGGQIEYVPGPTR